MIMSCAARGIKKVGQHWLKPYFSPLTCYCLQCVLRVDNTQLYSQVS